MLTTTVFEIDEQTHLSIAAGNPTGFGYSAIPLILNQQAETISPLGTLRVLVTDFHVTSFDHVYVTVRKPQ